MAEITVRRLAPGDEALLAELGPLGEAFDLADEDHRREPLPADRAAAFLANPAVCFWVAFDGDRPVGELYCLVVPLAYNDAAELLLYAVGVHEDYRRQGVGRRLSETMDAFMAAEGLGLVWVLADNPGAVAYYEAMGFSPAEDQPTYMLRG